jgi:LysM repeat protein
LVTRFFFIVWIISVGLATSFFSIDVASEEKIHVVAKGDSIAKIADFYGVAQRDLRNANGVDKNSMIDVGDQLVIPEVLRGGAGKSHVIQKGDTLLKVAKKYKVTIQDLADANKIRPKCNLTVGKTLVIPGTEDEDYELSAPKEKPISIEGGKSVKGGIQHTVQQGQTLWLIARAYHTLGDKIAKLNHIAAAAPLQVGQVLFIPSTAGGAAAGRGKGPAGKSVKFARVHNSKRLSLRLLNRKGRVNPDARLSLSKLARDRKGKKRYRLVHPRLIQLLQRVADQFPGQTIEIVSGYRAAVRGHRLSKHNVGQAVDFRVAAVSNRELYDFIKTLPKAGTGYYPNSVFVHLDVRDKSYTWTDVSGPGERAHYVKPGEGGLEEEGPTEAEADNMADQESDGELSSSTSATLQ